MVDWADSITLSTKSKAVFKVIKFLFRLFIWTAFPLFTIMLAFKVSGSMIVHKNATVIYTSANCPYPVSAGEDCKLTGTVSYKNFGNSLDKISLDHIVVTTDDGKQYETSQKETVLSYDPSDTTSEPLGSWFSSTAGILIVILGMSIPFALEFFLARDEFNQKLNRIYRRKTSP